MHPLDTLKRLEDNNAEARRIMAEHEQKKEDKPDPEACGYAEG